MYSFGHYILSYGVQDVNLQVWQSCVVSPQQAVPQAEAQPGPVK